MARNTDDSHELAILGGSPSFPDGNPVPLIQYQGDDSTGDFSPVDAIFANQVNHKSKDRASQQRVIAKILPGVGGYGPSHRVALQRRVENFLGLDPTKASVTCVSSGTNALRAVLRWVRASGSGESRNEIIVPQTTVGATIEAVIAEGFCPVFAQVDPKSWLLSIDATRHSISNKTAAILTVDWLGTLCELNPFRGLADEYDIKLISDSAQSFGAINGEPPSFHLAHATIYSMGYPKVFTSGGSGGLIVCPTEIIDFLENEPTGILRHETLAEVNAYMGLRALDSLPKDLERRRIAGELYRKLLACIPGITLQQVPAGLHTNHYQMSFVVDAEKFGLDAKALCDALKAENIHCSTARMPCVAVDRKLASAGRITGDLTQSHRLAVSSVTLPISNTISLETVKNVGRLIGLMQKHAQDIVRMKQQELKHKTPGYPSECPDIVDIESKFRRHLTVPILDDASVHSKVLVPFECLHEHVISIDELLDHFKSRRQWRRGEIMLEKLFIDAILGTVVVLAPCRAGQTSQTSDPIVLEESGSAARVTLVPSANGSLTVIKYAEGYGIDGNGAPWLRRQSLFLENSLAAKKSGMFVKPLQVIDRQSDITLVLPYVSSHSLGELGFANTGSEPLLASMVNMLARMATSVWTQGQEEADPLFVQKAHFSRMRRRVEIARANAAALDEILKAENVILNGRRLDGFDVIMKKLEQHPALTRIAPTILSEIHGDLNIHNVLSRLDPHDEQSVAVIDPRGVPLLGNSDADGKMFERGDYCYDVSKLLFSLQGFSEIRRRLFTYAFDGKYHKLEIQQHPGSVTMRGAADQLIPALLSSKVVRRWIDAVERDGARSFELRVKIGEAAHFVADCACALGRDTHAEVVPLFLIGLQKLNDVVDELQGHAQCALDTSCPLSDHESMPESADFGVRMIQQRLFEGYASGKKWCFDVLEFSVKAESAKTLEKLCCGMVGTYLPNDTAVYMSTDPIEHVGRFPCVLIHPSDGVRGQTHMLASAERRTTAFFKDNGVPQITIDNMKVVHVSSTGSSSRAQLTARDNDKLLSPGTFGISPLQLTLLQINQLPFPKPGRWVIENDSFFLLSRPLTMSGRNLCLLAIERPVTKSSSTWRVCVSESEQIKGSLFAKRFRDIQAHEEGEKLLRTTSGLFLPHDLAKVISRNECDYNVRTSPLLIDIVLPRFMERAEWLRLSHEQGYGARSHLVWQNAKTFESSAPLVELADGGDKMAFYHYGSDDEYSKLLQSALSKDARLNSLAYAGAVKRWRQLADSRDATLHI